MVSHTNTAVDQALVQIADRVRAINPELVAAGMVLRVGQPRDQRVVGDPDLLVSTHVERRSVELVERRTEAEVVRESAAHRVREVQRLVDIAEWIEVSAEDIAQLRADRDELHQLEATAAEIRGEAARAAAGRPELETRLASARDAIEAATELAVCRTTLRDVSAELEAATAAVARLSAEVSQAGTRLGAAEHLELVRLRLDELPWLERARDSATEATDVAGKWEAEVSGLDAVLEEARAMLEQTNAVGGLARRWKRLPAPEVQEARVSQLEGDLARARCSATPRRAPGVGPSPCSKKWRACWPRHRVTRTCPVSLRPAANSRPSKRT